MAKKTPFQRLWWFLWHDESAYSWIANVVLAFVLIKFLIYPGLGFMLGTSHPVVAVISGSMEHDGNLDDWLGSHCKIGENVFQQADFYSTIGISKEDFTDFRFKNGFNTGDLMVLKRPNSIDVGDVIVFIPEHEIEPVIHRVVSITEQNNRLYYTTKGDHNCGIGSNEENIPSASVVGEAVARVPFLGLVKLGFIKLLQLFGVA